MQQITVIGAGVVGICTAFFLQNSGYSVLLVDSSPPAEGCSKGNAGHFATEQVFPMADTSLLWQLPLMLLQRNGPLKIRAGYLLKSLPWFYRFMSNMSAGKQRLLQAALAQLNGPSLASWQKLATLCQSQDLFRFDGALLVSEQSSLKALQQHYKRYRAAGINVNVLNASESYSLEPALSTSIHGSLNFTDVAHTVDPWLLCQRIFAAFIAAGGQWQQTQLMSISAGKAQQLITTNGSFSTEKLVICAGAYSAILTTQLGWSIPLEAERGYHLMTQPVCLKRPVSSLERKFIMTPMQAGLRLAGTVEFSGLDSAPDYQRATQLLTHATCILTTSLQSSTSDAVWYGNRPSLPDSLPVIGPCPAHAGIYYNFGHQHLGLTQAAYSAELLTKSLKGELSEHTLHPFRIDRFGAWQPRQNKA